MAWGPAWRRRKDELRAFVDDIKMRAGCIGCGYCAHACALDFDHVDRLTKKKSVAGLVASLASKRMVLAEIAKCVVRCANCHRIKSLEQNDYARS